MTNFGTTPESILANGTDFYLRVHHAVLTGEDEENEDEWIDIDIDLDTYLVSKKLGPAVYAQIFPGVTPPDFPANFEYERLQNRLCISRSVSPLGT